jgi:hypothetical protein
MERYGLSPTDALIKTAIELAIEDLLKNPWIIEHMYAPFVENPILSKKYGYKEIERAKEFLRSNKINFYMKHRNDKMDFPCITISLSQSSEDRNLATLGDVSPSVIDYNPEEIDKPISYIIKPTNLLSYDPLTGIVEIGENENYKYISENMVAVDPETGNGYVILSKGGNNGFVIQTGLTIDFDKIAVIPQYLTYRARMERIVSQESYNIGCHVHGDPAQMVFLHNLVKYALLRYREGLFEHFRFDLGTISSTDTINNDAFGADEVYSRFITLSGQIEEFWVKSPARKWEVIDFIERDGDLKTSGIKIISNIKAGDQENDIWTTVDSEED